MIRRSFAFAARRGPGAAALLVLALLLPIAPPASLAEERVRPTAFLEAIADLPLMPGLEEVDEAGLVFDKPGGRIVEAYARGAVSAAQVRDFYRRTLPQLGWRATGASAYAREGERLAIDIAPTGGQTAVRFTLAPQ